MWTSNLLFRSLINLVTQYGWSYNSLESYMNNQRKYRILHVKNIFVFNVKYKHNESYSRWSNNKSIIHNNHRVLTCIATRGVAISYANITTLDVVVIFKLINSNLVDTCSNIIQTFLHEELFWNLDIFSINITTSQGELLLFLELLELDSIFPFNFWIQ